MFESHVQTGIDSTSFDFRFEDFFSNRLLKIIIYCVTGQQAWALVKLLSYFSHKKQSQNRSVDAIKISLPSISKICPEIQVLSFHGSDSTSEFDELPDEHWAKTIQ